MKWVLAFILFESTAAQVSDIGFCPDVSVKSDFNVAEFVGKWFEAQRYYNVFELGGKCVTFTYTANANGSVGVVNSQVSTVIKFAWLLTREQLPTKAALETAFAAIDKSGIDRTFFEVTDQQNCL